MTSWSKGGVTTWAKAALSLFNARSDENSSLITRQTLLASAALITGADAGLSQVDPLRISAAKGPVSGRLSAEGHWRLQIFVLHV
jgi:hypothetical protein